MEETDVQAVHHFGENPAPNGCVWLWYDEARTQRIEVQVDGSFGPAPGAGPGGAYAWFKKKGEFGTVRSGDAFHTFYLVDVSGMQR